MYIPSSLPTKERFEDSWTPEPYSGCWLWTRSVMNKRGYGAMNTSKETRYAHRVSWQIYNGEIPSGMHVCHHCDTPACVNPSHLFLGTHADNMRDARAKGRAYTPRRKLTPLQVAEIRTLAHEELSSRMRLGKKRRTQGWLVATAKHFGVCKKCIQNTYDTITR
jgi:hypothetical protein